MSLKNSEMMAKYSVPLPCRKCKYVLEPVGKYSRAESLFCKKYRDYQHRKPSGVLFCNEPCEFYQEDTGESRGDASDDEDWVTINGTHVLLNGAGEAQSGGRLKGKTFTAAESEKPKPKSGAGEKSKAKTAGAKVPGGKTSFSAESLKMELSPEIRPKRDDYDLKRERSDISAYQEFSYKNKDKLMPVYKESGRIGLQNEFYRARLSAVTRDFKEISRDEAEEILSENLYSGTLHAWFREYNNDVREDLVCQLTRNPETHNAALNQMYNNYKVFCETEKEEPLSFEEFLVTPIKMYRGGSGKEHKEAAVFSSYTFDREAAELFTDSDYGSKSRAGLSGVVYDASIRPIDTYGSVYYNGEMEILVPRGMAPNGNRDSEDDEKSIDFDDVRDIVSLREFILSFANGANLDEHIPEDRVVFKQSEEGKTYAFDPKTGATSGLGPDIDNKTTAAAKKAKSFGTNPTAKVKHQTPTHFANSGGKVTITESTKVKVGDKGRTRVPPQTLRNVEAFAGVGCKKPLEKEKEIMAVFGGKSGEWKHYKGIGIYESKNGKMKEVEIHWFEHETIGQIGWKIKKFIRS